MIKRISALLILTLVFANCSSDSADDFPNESPTDVTYTQHIKPIMSANCTSCHNSGANPVGPFPLETYAQVKDKTQNGNLLQRIELPDGNPLIMPQSGRMSQSKINIIKQWKDEGYLED